MKLTTILVLALSMLGFAGNLMAEDLHTYLEFTGPWSFIPVKNNASYCGTLGKKCTIAISLSKGHKPAMFNDTSLNKGVYILMLQGSQPVIGGGKPPKFVDGLSVLGARLQELLTKPSKNRYVVILPYAPLEWFEQPDGDGYSEKAKITDDFVPFYQTNPAMEITYAKGVRIHYTVSSLSTTLSGKDDAGNPVSIQKTAPIIFSINPGRGTIYICDLHARLSFRRMHDLFHPQPRPKPRKYVDFPDYGWRCRVGDPQQDGLPLLFYSLDSKTINIHSVMKLINSLERLANALNSQQQKAKEGSLYSLLEDVRKYLQDRSTDPKEGNELINRLDQIIQAIGEPTDPKRTEKENALLRRLGLIRLLVEVKNNDSGANCKAPMMSVTVQ